MGGTIAFYAVAIVAGWLFGLLGLLVVTVALGVLLKLGFPR